MTAAGRTGGRTGGRRTVRRVVVMVDEAVWPWRGRRWAHLASDASLDELHAFAAELGLARAMFQGDHYDVPTEVRERALALGAVATESRELVRRVRVAGLRRPGARRLVS